MPIVNHSRLEQELLSWLKQYSKFVVAEPLPESIQDWFDKNRIEIKVLPTISQTAAAEYFRQLDIEYQSSYFNLYLESCLYNYSTINNVPILSLITKEQLLYQNDIFPSTKVAPWADLYCSEVEELLKIKLLEKNKEITLAQAEWMDRENIRSNILREPDPSKSNAWLGYLAWQKTVTAKVHSWQKSNLTKLIICPLREKPGLLR